jgi:hypothetical protein
MSDRDHLEAARRLRAALDRTGDALLAARLDDLLAAERELADPRAAWPAGTAIGGDHRAPLAAETDRLRASLARCRRLGATLAAIAGASAGPGWARDYDRRGTERPPAVRGGLALEARV